MPFMKISRSATHRRRIIKMSWGDDTQKSLPEQPIDDIEFLNAAVVCGVEIGGEQVLGIGVPDLC